MVSSQSLSNNKHDRREAQQPKAKAKQQQKPTLRRSSRIQKNERTKNGDSSSSIAEHEESTGHHMDWKNFRVLWRDNNVYRLLIKESLVIRAHEPWLNRTTHSVPLLVFPEGLERHLVPDPNGWPFSLFSLSIEKRTSREVKNRRKRRPVTIQTTNEHACFLPSFMSSPSSRTRRLFVTSWSRAALLIKRLFPSLLLRW